MKKIRLGFVFGYNSAEAEGSLRSARHIVENADSEKYDAILIAVDKQGCWRLQPSLENLIDRNYECSLKPDLSGNRLGLTPGGGELVDLDAAGQAVPVDVIFPLIPGPSGEDGTVQGMLKLAHIPFVGADVMGSAAGMDKEVTRRLCRDADIPMSRFLTVYGDKKPIFEEVVENLGLPFFIKPASMGTSIGISKVERKADYQAALRKAFSYDNKLVIEEAIEAREVEIAVLGSDKPLLSVPGEVLHQADWYSYHTKFLDPNGSDLEIPARLSSENAIEIRRLARLAYRTLGCEGFARLDFFIDPDDNIMFNEINTIPCLSRFSSYTLLWEASDVPVGELIDRLVSLALERFQRDERLRRWHENWDLEGVVRPLVKLS
jgi:D-alanine-D-alanine ligase